uniref:Uncharacterized protein n=1 Tax=Tanacetum cinerariifolium TaxID=118510 RepID=A0A6L2MF57_TANCI|nr:hypothetical protein [Tanacetum cinerariifolium]
MVAVNHVMDIIVNHVQFDEVTKSNAENFLPIPSKCEVTLEDEIECDMPVKDVCSPVFTTFSNPLFKDNDDFDSSDDESLSDEDDGNSQQEEIDIVTKTDDVLPSSVENDDDLSNDSLLEVADLFLVSDNSIPSDIENDSPLIPRPPPESPDDELDLEPDSGKDISAVVNKDVSDDKNDDYCSFMFVIQFFLPYLIFPEISPLFLSAESEDTIFDPDDVLPPSDDYDPLLGEANLFLSDDSIPPGYPVNLRPPPEPPDDNFDLEPEVISAVMENIDEPDEHFNLGGEIFVSTNNEDVDYFPFMFVIQIFLPYLILPGISPLLLFAESEDTIFDPGIFDYIQRFLVGMELSFALLLIHFCESPIEIVIFYLLSLRTTEFWDRVEPTTRIIPQRLKFLVLDICSVSKIFISFD